MAGLLTVDDSLRTVRTAGVAGAVIAGVAAVVGVSVTVPGVEHERAVVEVFADVVATVDAAATPVPLGVITGCCPEATWP